LQQLLGVYPVPEDIDIKMKETAIIVAKTLVANLWGQFQTKEKDVVGESPSRYRIDFGLKYLLCNKKLSIGIEYQNMLASHEKSIIKSNGITYIYDYKPYRVLNISISYQFGKKLNVHPKKIGINTNRL